MKMRREGRCIIGKNPDGSDKLCLFTCRCTGCPEKGLLERRNTYRVEILSLDYEYDGETFDIEDKSQPSVEDQVLDKLCPKPTEEELKIKLLAHFDKQYSRKYDDKQNRLSRLYDDIADIEEQIEVIRARIESIQQQKISGESIYKILLYFDKLYNKFTDLQKKEFMSSFIDEIQIYEEPNADGQLLKHIKFKFPVYYNGMEVKELSWDNESTIETCVLLSRKKSGANPLRLR